MNENENTGGGTWQQAKVIAENLYRELRETLSPGQVQVMILLLEIELNRAQAAEAGDPVLRGTFPEVEKLFSELQAEFPPGMIRIILRALEKHLNRVEKVAVPQRLNVQGRSWNVMRRKREMNNGNTEHGTSNIQH